MALSPSSPVEQVRLPPTKAAELARFEVLETLGSSPLLLLRLVVPPRSSSRADARSRPSRTPPGTGTFGRVLLVRVRSPSTPPTAPHPIFTPAASSSPPLPNTAGSSSSSAASSPALSTLPPQSMPHFALKVLAKAEIVRLKQVEHIQSERGILGRVKHPFIVELCVPAVTAPCRLACLSLPTAPASTDRSARPGLLPASHLLATRRYQTYQDPINVYMLLSYVPGGELFSHLRRAGRFTADVTRFYLSSIILAIACASAALSSPSRPLFADGRPPRSHPPDLHSQDIIYRDLKPENLLLDRDGYLRYARALGTPTAPRPALDADLREPPPPADVLAQHRRLWLRQGGRRPDVHALRHTRGSFEPFAS